jgi:hypothetical protein
MIELKFMKLAPDIFIGIQFLLEHNLFLLFGNKNKRTEKEAKRGYKFMH